jgi:ribosomal protein S27AE
MPDNSIVAWIARAIGAIILIGSASTIVATWLKPLTNMEKRLKSLEYYRTEQDKVSKDLQECSHLLCKVMFILLDHEITGNSIEGLKKTREELREYLIKK